MRRLSWLSLGLVLLVAPAAHAQTARSFGTIELSIDSSDAELSGWQLSAGFSDPEVQIVGIEGGSDPAFADPPRYDPRALHGHRIILAALAVGPALPSGTTAVARLHIEFPTGSHPELEVLELIAVDRDGQATPATLVQQNGEER